MKMKIRNEHNQDYTGIKDLLQITFQRENEARLVDAIRSSKGYIPELSFVAVNGNQIAGYIMFSKAWIDREEKIMETLVLAPLAVLPEYQKLGIGSILVQRGLEVVHDLGYPHVFVLGHPGYYPRFGFMPAKERGISCPYSVPDPAFMVYEVREKELAGVEGTLIYPPAFNEVE
jgi:putative acetyltransferase